MDWSDVDRWYTRENLPMQTTVHGDTVGTVVELADMQVGDLISVDYDGVVTVRRLT